MISILLAAFLCDIYKSIFHQAKYSQIDLILSIAHRPLFQNTLYQLCNNRQYFRRP